MEKASGMKKTNAAWSADIFKSGNTFELFIVDEGSRQTIVCSPVDLADASSVINLLRGAFSSFGAPAELRTDGATFFARFFIGIILGLVAEFAFMVPSTRMVLSSSAARWKHRKQIGGLKSVSDSRFEVLGLNIEDTVTIEFARFLPLVGLSTGETFHGVRNSIESARRPTEFARSARCWKTFRNRRPSTCIDGFSMAIWFSNCTQTRSAALQMGRA